MLWRLRFRFIFLLSLQWFVCAGAHAGTTFTIESNPGNPNEGDTFTTTGPSNNLTGSNYGGAGSIAIAASGMPKGEFKSVIRFDAAEAAATLNELYGTGKWAVDATLIQLRVTNPNNAIFNNPNTAGSFQVQWLQDDSWIEGNGTPMNPNTIPSAITWNGIAALTAAGVEHAGSFVYGGDAIDAQLQYALTSTPGLVDDVQDGARASFLLSATTAGMSVNLGSRSHTTPSNRPALVITASAIDPITTGHATALTPTSATLHGFVRANNENVTVSFDYGLSTTYDSSASATPPAVTGNTETPVSGNLANLTPATTYHYRVRVDNGMTTDFGEDRTFTTPGVPEIAVESDTGAGLTDGVGNIFFGDLGMGRPGVVKVFTIRNLGSATLNLSDVSATGDHAGDFIVNTTGTAQVLAPTQSTTFSITFTPGAIGARNAALQIQSDDADETIFDVALTGAGHVISHGVISIDPAAGSIITVREDTPQGDVKIPILRTGGSDDIVGFSITTKSGTAKAGSDFTAPPTLQNLGDGVASLNVPIPILNSAGTSEPIETFTVTLSNATGAATLGALRTITVRIIDSLDTTRPLQVDFDSSRGSVTTSFAPSPTYREVGRSYTITATPKSTPAPGSLFAGWEIGGDDVARGGIDFELQRLGIVSGALEKQTLTFIFREGLILTAKFVENPYGPSVTGTYNGLIKASADKPDRPGDDDGSVPGVASEGYFTAMVMSSGAFSGKLLIDGFALNIAGSFDEKGQARFGTARALTQTVARLNKPSLSVKLHIGGPQDSEAPPGKITGQVTATTFRYSALPTSVSEVVASRAHFTGLTAPLTVPDAYLTVTGAALAPIGRTDGLFTVRLPSRPIAVQPDRIKAALTEDDYPRGDGVGTIRITKAGLVTLAATLADGTPMTASSSLAEDLTASLFAQLYSLKGFLSVPVKLNTNEPASDLHAPPGSAVLWSRSFNNTSHYYPHGWAETIEIDLLGARYVVATGKSALKAANQTDLPPPDADGNVALTFTGGLLDGDLIKSANLGTTDNVIKVPDNDPTFTMAVNRLTGLITGKFTHTDDTVPGYSAVIFQKGPNAGAFGYFLTKQPVPIDYTGESGRVMILAHP